jgi:hypothetical protein
VFQNNSKRRSYRMAKRKKIDEKKLLKMVEDGIHQSEIMKKLGIKTTNQLWIAYGKAQSTAGKIPAIVGGRGAGKAVADENRVKVGKRGSVIIPQEMIKEFGFADDTEFTVKKRGDNIITLKKVEPEAPAEEKTED